MPDRHVLLSNERALGYFGTPPDGVRLRVWDGSGEAPPGIGETGFWVPQFLGGQGIDTALALMPALEVIQLTTAGADAFVEHVPAGVLLCDARGVHGGSTSEWVLTVTLAVYRQLPRFVAAQAERRWDYAFTDELAGKRVLVVGAGDVGGQVRRKLETFDTEVTMVARRSRPGVAAVSDLPGLLPGADVVVVVVPLTPATRGLVGPAFLGAMKDGALLVNGSRGPVVDTVALLAELQRRRLLAALDVTDPEPLPSDHPLWTAPGLLLTPHVAGSVRGLSGRAYALVRAQLARWLAGEPLHNIVADGY